MPWIKRGSSGRRFRVALLPRFLPRSRECILAPLRRGLCRNLHLSGSLSYAALLFNISTGATRSDRLRDRNLTVCLCRLVVWFLLLDQSQ